MTASRRRVVSGLLAAAAALAPAAAAGQQPTTVTFTLNPRVVSGTFGSAATTTLVYAPAGVRVETGRLEISALFPYLTVHNGTVALSQGGYVPLQGSLPSAPASGVPMGGGRAGAMNGMGGMGGMTGSAAAQPVGIPPAEAFTPADQSGFGDIVLDGAYRVVDDRIRGVQVLLGGVLKIPTASASRGLGTGRADAGLLASVRKQFVRSWMYAEGGALHLGEPDGVALRTAALWSAGGGYRLNDRIALLAMASGNSSVVTSFGGSAEIGAGLGVRLGETVFTIVPAIGLSDASPSYTINLGFSANVLRR